MVQEDQQTQCSGLSVAGGVLPWRFMVLSILLVAVGCGHQGRNLPLEPVKGTVTYQGKLLDHGEVVFTPQAGTPGPVAVGTIQPNGSFVMQTAGLDGAVVGSHKVTVHCRRKLTPEQIRKRSLEVPQSLIPDKYWKQGQSQLTFEVEVGAPNVYTIALE